MACSKIRIREANYELNWVSCDTCQNWFIFDSCKAELGLEVFDESKIANIGFVCRMCRYEDRLVSTFQDLEIKITEVSARITKLENNSLEFNVLRNNSEDLERKCKFREDLVDETIAIIKNRTNKLESKRKDFEKQLGELSSRIAIVEVSEGASSKPSGVCTGKELDAERLNIMETPSRVSYSDSISVGNKIVAKSSEVAGSRGSISFGEKCKEFKSNSVIIVGDSIARNVGDCLERDSNMFSKLSMSGARIEDVEDKLKNLGDMTNSHIVVQVGTNNLKKDGTEEIMRKFQSLITVSKNCKFRRLSLVGILRRKDVSSYMDSKRIGINLRLREMCKQNGIEYVHKDIVSEHLGRDGLHLSTSGQDEVARTIFRHCKHFLNGIVSPLNYLH